MDRASLLEQVKAREELERRKIDARCKVDPMYWLRNHTSTYDPKALRDGLNPIRPFPDWKYLDYLMYFLSRPKEYPRIFIPKSRELMTSWLVASYATHVAQYVPFSHVLVQTEIERKALDLLSYCSAIYNHQPLWLRQLHPLKHGQFQTRPGKDKELELHFQHGSRIVGLTSSPNAVAGHHPSLAILDEAALWPDSQLSYQLALPVAAQIVLISSARPGWFGDEAGASPGPHGIPESIDKEKTRELIANLQADPAMQTLQNMQREEVAQTSP